jgi:hypothetical protein
MGLVCTGSATRSFVARMPAVLARLGPIKASSFRVARQISRSLRAGQAVSHYSVLESCPIVWFAVPDTVMNRTLRDFMAQTAIRDNMIVLCDCEREIGEAARLARAGARVASLNPIPEPRDRSFVAEGHPETVRTLRRLLAEDDRKLIELRAGMKPLFFAGIRFSAPLLMPWIASAIESLRAAGLSRADAVAVVEHIGTRTLRRYIKAGDRAWNRQTAGGLRHALEYDLEAVRGQDPRLSELYAKAIRIAIEKF